MVDVDVVEGGESGEEIGREGREVVVVGEEDLKRLHPGEARKRSGELVVLNFQLLQIRKLLDFRRQRAGEFLITQLDFENLAVLATHFSPFAVIGAGPPETVGADAFPECFHGSSVVAAAAGLGVYW